MTYQENIHDLLKKAKAILAERGMTKGRMAEPSGEVCMAGALVIAHGGISEPGCINLRTAEMIDECRIAMGLGSVATFNDHPHTTLEIALEAFQRGIDATAPPTPAPEEPALEEPESERELVLA